MRAVLLTLLLVGCGTDRTCTAETCAQACEVGGYPPFQPDQASAFVLTAAEATRLRSELDDLRQGARLDPARVGLCRGAVGCAEALGRDPRPLAPGSYHLQVPYTLPHRADPTTWSLSVHASCVAARTFGELADAPEQLRAEELPLPGPEGELDVLAFEVVDDGLEHACAWRVQLLPRGGVPVGLDGRYRVAPAGAETDVPDAPPSPTPPDAP